TILGDHIRYNQDEVERKLPKPMMEDPLNEKGSPLDEDDDVGVSVGFSEWMTTSWAARVVDKITRLGLDEEDEEEMTYEEEVEPGGDEGGDGG
ncbi:hypothetical protein KI387_016516, partial [Taxus chinensis]